MIPYKELILTKEYWKEVIENRMISLRVVSVNTDEFIDTMAKDILKALNEIKE